MSAVAVVALLPEWRDVIFDCENADGGEVGIAFQRWPKGSSLVSLPSRMTPQGIPDSVMEHDCDFFTQQPEALIKGGD